MIGIVDYGMGNIKSVANSVYEQGFDPIICRSPDDFEDATHIILPGVGHYKRAMENIGSLGLIPLLNEHIIEQKKPLLGICLGMQLLLSHSDEGDVKGLNFIRGQVKKFDESYSRVPHVGWNEIVQTQSHPVLTKIKPATDLYFVHSYFCQTEQPGETLATTEYQQPFAAIIGRDNIIGMQFHPEKSQLHGLNLLEAFCDWDGQC